MERTVLIVDDSESVREVISFTLENAGYMVLRSADGSDALKFLNGTPIDLIIADLHMPIMDGLSLLKAIRANKNYQYTPVLILTTESHMTKKQEAKSAGATGWIVKPFVPDKLLAAVQKVIR